MLQFIVSKLLKTMTADEAYQYILTNHYDLATTAHYQTWMFGVWFGLACLIPMVILLIIACLCARNRNDEVVGFSGAMFLVVTIIMCSSFAFAGVRYYDDPKSYILSEIKKQNDELVKARLLLERQK